MPKIESRAELSSRTGARESSEQLLAVNPGCRFFCATSGKGSSAPFPA